jgi:hypothetical protein
MSNALKACKFINNGHDVPIGLKSIEGNHA